MKAAQPKAPPAARDDAELVKRCAQGDQQAWAELVDKYKNLIFSIPIKYGFTREDAAEVFQQVCLELLTYLNELRNPTGLAKWLMQVTSHRCYHWKQQSRRMVSESEAPQTEVPATAVQHPIDVLREAEREQALRDAIAILTPRCREMIRMLFFEDAPRPYSEVASALGMASGSVGFIRGRCLEKLRAHLEKMGHA